jgi:hypothetical protein
MNTESLKLGCSAVGTGRESTKQSLAGRAPSKAWQESPLKEICKRTQDDRKKYIRPTGLTAGRPTYKSKK